MDVIIWSITFVFEFAKLWLDLNLSKIRLTFAKKIWHIRLEHAAVVLDSVATKLPSFSLLDERLVQTNILAIGYNKDDFDKKNVTFIYLFILAYQKKTPCTRLFVSAACRRNFNPWKMQHEDRFWHVADGCWILLLLSLEIRRSRVNSDELGWVRGSLTKVHPEVFCPSSNLGHPTLSDILVYKYYRLCVLNLSNQLYIFVMHIN